MVYRTPKTQYGVRKGATITLRTTHLNLLVSITLTTMDEQYNYIVPHRGVPSIPDSYPSLIRIPLQDLVLKYSQLVFLPQIRNQCNTVEFVSLSYLISYF